MEELGAGLLWILTLGGGAHGGRGGLSKSHSLLHEFIRCIEVERGEHLLLGLLPRTLLSCTQSDFHRLRWNGGRLVGAGSAPTGSLLPR